MSEYVYANTASQTIDIFLQDSSSSTGQGLAGLVFDSASLVASYRKGATGSRTAITLATQTVGGAWSSGGFVEIDATNMKGVYRLDIPNAAVDTEGFVTLYLYGATNLLPTALRIDCRPLPVDVKKFGGTNGTFTSGKPDVQAAASVSGAVGSVTGAVGSVTGNVGGNLNGNVVGSVASVSGNVSGSVGSVTGAVGSVTGSVGSVVGNVGGSTASVAGAVGSVTGNVGGDVSGKVLGGGAGTISGDGVRAASVTGAVGSVTGSVGSVVGAVELDSAAILAVADQVWDEAMSGHTTAGTYGGRIVRATNSNTEVQITGSNHIAADIHDLQSGVITAGDFAANSITASALATDAVTEIQSGLATAATALSTTQWTNTLATDLGTTNTTVATNLNATVSSRSTQTSVDTIDDLLDTEMPALTASVAAEAVKTSAIKAKTDNLPADPADASDIASSFSTVNTKLDTIDDFLDTEIAAIKAKTDNLPTDPADQSLVEAAITAATSPLATPAQVNAEVVDVLSVDTFAELTAPPAATSSLKDKITWLFMYARNKVTQTSSQRKLYLDDATTVAGTSGTSDNGTTFTKGEDS